MRSAPPVILLASLLAVSVFAAAGAGCGTVTADVGYAAPVDGQPTGGRAAVDLRVSTGGLVAFGVAAHSTFASNLQTVAFSPELTVGVEPGGVYVGARGGVRLLQLERYDDDWSVASLSPYGGPLVGFPVNDHVRFVLSATAEYERHGGAPERDGLLLGGEAGVALHF